MPTGLKLVAVLCCMVPWLNMGIMRMRESSKLPITSVTREQMRAEREANENAKDGALVTLIVAEIGAVILLIDALLRDYDSPRGWPIAIALVGLLSLGLLSLVYYAIWGYQPTRRAVPLAEDFCPECKAATSEQSAPSLMMHNLLGTQFLGHAERCTTCGSSIRTIWFSVIVPLIPCGSYRVLHVGKALAHRSQFVSRKTKLRASHLFQVYGFVLAILILVFWLARR